MFITSAETGNAAPTTNKHGGLIFNSHDEQTRPSQLQQQTGTKPRHGSCLQRDNVVSPVDKWKDDREKEEAKQSQQRQGNSQLLGTENMTTSMSQQNLNPTKNIEKDKALEQIPMHLMSPMDNTNSELLRKIL